MVVRAIKAKELSQPFVGKGHTPQEATILARSISAVGTALGTMECMLMQPCDLQTYFQSSINVMAFTAEK